LQWSGGTVVVKLGIDLPGKPAMAYADYATLATWLVDTWNINDAEFILGFKEPKGRIQKDIATDVFDKVDYPNLPDNSAGKVIPIAYGKVQGVCASTDRHCRAPAKSFRAPRSNRLTWLRSKTKPAIGTRPFSKQPTLRTVNLL
jgi:hypothetical protein